LSQSVEDLSPETFNKKFESIQWVWQNYSVTSLLLRKLHFTTTTKLVIIKSATNLYPTS
jgi:hypothetical protein